MALQKMRIVVSRLSLLWKYMLMISSVLAFATIALVIVYNVSIDRLREEKLTEVQLALERDTSNFEAELYNTLSIPVAIEGNSNYGFIENEDSLVLDKKYYPVLMNLRNALLNQVYLRDSNTETLLYLRTVNCIVTNRAVFTDVQKCFSEAYRFSTTDAETIISILRKRNLVQLLPVEEISINGGAAEKHLIFITCPINRNVAVMTMYSETLALEKIGYNLLPEGTCVKIISKTGEILEHYPADCLDEEKSYTLSANMDTVRAKVTISIPEAYLTEQVAPTSTMIITLIAVVLLIGLSLVVLVSFAVVHPLREIIKEHDGAAEGSFNEIQRLDQVLTEKSNRNMDLQHHLLDQLLTRIFSGSFLSSAEEKILLSSNWIPNGRFVLAITHTDQNFNLILGSAIQERIPEAVVVLISQKETGLVLPGDPELCKKLETTIAELNAELMSENGGISCGISSSVTALSDIYRAAHQARIAIPLISECRTYRENDEAQDTTWLQYERLYHCLCTDDIQNAEEIVNHLANTADQRNGKEIFYNIRAVIRSVSDEMGIHLSTIRHLEYLNRDFPSENIGRLFNILQELSQYIKRQREGKVIEQQEGILDYIQANISNYNLCAAMVADHFSITEKSVYDAIRKTKDQSFGEFLVSQRMKQAALLLSTTQMTIADIMVACGYQSTSTFYRVFKKYYGVAPKQYLNGDQS